MDRANQYKQRHAPFGSAGARMVRAKKIEERRKERRAEHLSRIRNDNIVDSDNDELGSKEETREDRKTRLEKWKAERDLKKKLEAKKKKPIFKVGVPHHNIFSPTSGESPMSHCHHRSVKQCQNIKTTLPKRITRATEKRLASKRVLLEYCDTSVKNHDSKPKKIQKVDEIGKNESPITNKTDKVQHIAPNDYVFKGPLGIDPLPLFGRIWIPLSEESNEKDVKSSNQLKATSIQCESENVEAHQHQPHTLSTMSKCEVIVDECGEINSVECTAMKNMTEENLASYIRTQEVNRTPSNCSPVPAEFSPYIVASRGKKHAREEQRFRLGLNNSLTNAIPTKDTVMQNMNISIEEEEKTAQYYKILLRQQIEKLTDLCAEWEKIQNDPVTTDDGKYMINQAIGQAKLLMQKKFERFRGLVSDCETGKGEMLVRCRDLQAFWDIIMMQIKDCDSRFEKLSELKKTNWIENNTEVIGIKKKPIANKKKKIFVKSSMRAFIQAARKKNLRLTSNDPTSKHEKDEDTQIEPRYISTEQGNPITPQSKTHLLKNMEKLRETSFTVIKVSRISKTPKINLDSTISYVNINQTPGKSILKKSENVDRDGIIQKSACKVNFNDTVITNDQAYSEIDDIVSSSGVEKKLDFDDDDSFNEEKNKNDLLTDGDNISSIPNVRVTSPTPNTKFPLTNIDHNSPLLIPNIVPLSSNVKTPRKIKARSIDTPFNNPSMFNTRVLRNRAIATDNLPTKHNSSLKKRNSSSIVEVHACSADHNAKENEFQTFNQRRSSRRSVKFDIDEGCTACLMIKPVLPMTPKRNKKLSLSEDMNHQISTPIPSNNDLISFDSPIIPRRRSKRMSKK